MSEVKATWGDFWTLMIDSVVAQHISDRLSASPEN